MIKHTPGPWRLRFGEDIEHDYIVSHASSETLLAWTNYAKITKAHAKANAKLIAAAPDLLEALLYAIKQVPELATVPGISSAIKKATGCAA